MFAKTIIDSDAFLDMPTSTQALYFHLGMRADDDGFINNPKKIQRLVGGGDDDLKLLIAKKFIIPFESGIVVIKHWKLHNYIQGDRYKPTVYQEEKQQLTTKNNKVYTTLASVETSTMYPECVQDGNTGKVRLGKVRLDKVSKEDIYGEFQNVKLTTEQYEKLVEKFPYDYQDRIEDLSVYMDSKGKTYSSHYATILNWSRKEEKEKKSSNPFKEVYLQEERNEQKGNCLPNGDNQNSLPRILPPDDRD
jgi:hypothetical protein